MKNNPQPIVSGMIKDLTVNDVADVDRFRKILASINNSGDQFIVKEQGKPQAAILPLADLRLLQEVKINKEKAWKELFGNMHDVHALNVNFSAEEVDRDVDEAISAIRNETS